MMHAQRQLREELAKAGIKLEDAKESPPAAPALPESAVDRAEVRRILAPKAPARDLEWLVESCPSLDDARAYQRPPDIAWCVTCGGPSLVGELGCATCVGGAP